MPNLDKEVQKLFEVLLRGMECYLKDKWKGFVSNDLNSKINECKAKDGFADLQNDQIRLQESIKDLEIQLNKSKNLVKGDVLIDSQDEIQRPKIADLDSLLKEKSKELITIQKKILKISQNVNLINTTYDNMFDTIFRDQNENFKERFNQLKPKELFTRLWKVHSWLASDESSYWSTSLSVTIIQKMIQDRFLKIIPEKAFQLSSGKYLLNSLVDAQELTEDECRNFWFKSSDIFELSKRSQKVTITTQSGYYQRFQLYAYFKGNNFKKVLVLNFDELQYYQTVLEPNFLDIVLLNLGKEDQAQWVLMMKTTSQSWHVYLPKEYETLFNDNFKPRLSFVKFDVNVIDLEEYQQFNSLYTKLKLDELWVCFLVSRLYPALLSSKSYMDYRKDMAPHVLLELTKNALSIYDSKFYSLAPYSLSIGPNIITVPNSYLFQGEDTVDVSELHKNLADMYDKGSIQLQKMNSSTYYDQLSIQKTISEHQFFQCIELSERLKLTCISFHIQNMSILKSPNFQNSDQFIKLLDFNPTITEVTPKDRVISDQWISELYFASARNRFLKAYDASYDDFLKRKELWNQAGFLMRDYLQQNDFNLDFVNQVTELAAPSTNEHLWKYVQMAQMGKRGLDVLFDKVLVKYVENWNGLYQEPAPQLYGLFDLHGWFASGRESYIQDLTKKIQNFNAQCAPLFKKIGLILSTSMSECEQSAVIALLKVISTRKQFAPEEPNVIELYGVSESLLEKIPENLHVSISIPSWDRMPIKDSTMRRYRILQNRLEQNIRSDQAKRDLANIPKGLDDYQKGEFEVSFLRHIREEEQVLIWPTEDVTYPLNTGDVGIQQQLQQQVMQEYQQEVQQQAQKQVELEKEFQHHIGTYGQPEHDLITRDNIEHKMRNYWNALPQDIRCRSGLGEGDDLSKLFDVFVGCSRKGRHIIERIEIETMKKLMRHASECRLGVDYHHWAGFRVSESKGDRAYILTYNEKIEKEDIASQQQLEINKKDPFFKVLRESLSLEVFRGDYLQFKLISDKLTEQKLCWYYLAKEDDDQARKDELNSKFQQGDSRFKALMLAQQIHGDTTPMPELSPINCIEVLKKWASVQHEDTPFIEALFSDWTPIQLQAFGQLFNVYGHIPQAYRLSGQVLAAATTPENLEVVQLWLTLAYEVYQASPETFDIWKNRILMARLHWAEVMEEAEVVATLTCINTLKEKNNQFYNHLFWKMIDAHGKSVGPMRLSEVWYGFKKFIQYLEESHIKFTSESMEQYFELVVDFNASLFLKRLLYTLQDVSKGYEGEKFQVDILEHIHEIDWRESGLKMAIQEYQYRFWHPMLLLSDFNPLSTNQSIGNYMANFDCQWIDSIDEGYYVTYTLRFIAQNLNVTKDDFEEYTRFFENYRFSNIDMYRLMMISIIMGQDSLEDIKKVGEPITTFDLKVLNQNLPIDITKPLSYKLRFQDLALFSQFIKISGLDLSRFDLSGLNRVGFALHSMTIFCADDSNQSKLKRLGHLLSIQLKSSPYQVCPWLITDVNHSIPYAQPWHQQLALLLKEIDLKHTRWLPDLEKIRALFSCPSNIEAMNMLEQWCGDGCALNLETHRYRLLNPDEKSKILQAHTPKLLPAFADDNSNLLKKFLEKIVIDKRYEIESQLKNLFQVFESIDCKRYYNELGLVLTSLNQSERDLVYRVDVLSSWFINSFYDQEKLKRGPFPVQFLSQLVKFCGENRNTNLLNLLPQIQHQSTQFNAMQRQFSEVIKSDMPYDVQKILIQVATQYSGDIELFNKTKSCLKKIASCSYTLKKQFLSKMHDSLERREQLLDCLHLFNQILALQSGNRELDASFQISVLKNNIYTNFSNPMITMILQLTANRPFIRSELQETYDKLELWATEEIKKLADYYLDGPRPNWSAMHKLIKDENITQAQEFIHIFESKIMAEGKRDYSVLETDKNNLMRILKEIKYKKQAGLSDQLQNKYLNAVYYVNQYSVAHQLDIQPFSEILSKIEDLRKKNEFYYNSALIACLREVIVRKTGKWLNHTQVLDLVYASEQKESFLQQIKTGEGKSIISCARVAYHALHGQTVDIFSSKPELPARDIKEFSNVYKSLGIRHSLIQTNSPRGDYHDNLDQGKGAIHYSTVGQMLLFISGVFWKGEKSMDLRALNRVCYLDEADSALIKNHTECNYSDQDENSTVYNLDAWVYRITYEYYLTHQNEIEKNNAISILKHLKPLCECLQKNHATYAPENSRFFQKFILPDPSHPDDEERMNVRIMELLKLLMAARAAFNLKENIQFSCRPEIRSLGEGVEILTEFAKVIIDNQIIEGSTYCDNVHQILHTLLNKQAIHQDHLPNFFIEPSSEIVVSFIPEYGIKNFYHRIEGLTGTSGGEEELSIYRDKFSIPHVIKLPPHAEIQSEYLADIYASDFKSQVGKIVELYQQYSNHPFLITCQDDKEVERIAAELKNDVQQVTIQLSEDLRDEEEQRPKFILDTNKTGRTEEEVLPFANRPGSITISSRMGRGTDIKLIDKDSWLIHVGTNPETPRIEKQRRGRQGRNGAMGLTVNIYNYQDIQKDYTALKDKQGFHDLYENEKIHLEEKLKKHQVLKKTNKKNWKEMFENPELQEKYLITRTVTIYKERLKDEHQRPHQFKNRMISDLSWQLFQLLAKEKSKAKQEDIRNQWKIYRRKIEQSWKEHLQQYSEDFIVEVKKILFDSSYHFPEFKNEYHQKMDTSKVSGPQEKLDASIEFYQKYFQGWKTFLENSKDEPLGQMILNDHTKNLTALFKIFERLSSDFPHSKAQLPFEKNTLIQAGKLKSSKFATNRKKKLSLKTRLFNKLGSLMEKPHFYYISGAQWQEILNKLLDSKNPLVIDKAPLWMETFFDAIKDFRVPQTEQECQRLSRLFNMLQKIYRIAGIQDIDILKQFTSDLLPLCARIDENHLNKMVLLLTKNSRMTRRLIQESNQADLQHIVKTIEIRDTCRIKSFVQCWTVDFSPEEGAIHPIYNLMVQYDKSNIIPNIFPRAQFDWLSQHPGYSLDDLNQWMQLDFNLMKALPPYVSLSYIVKQLSDPQGKYPKLPLTRRISGIAEYTKTFNEFLLSRGVIASVTDYQDPILMESYDKWVEKFDQLDSAKDITFFALCRDLKVSDAYLLALVDKPEYWNKWIDCARMIQNLPLFDAIMTENIALENPFSDWMRLIDLCKKYPSLNTQWVELFYGFFKELSTPDALIMVKDLEDIAEDLTKIKDAADIPFPLFKIAYSTHPKACMRYTQYLAQGSLDSELRDNFLEAWKHNSYQEDFLELHVQTLRWTQNLTVLKKHYQQLLGDRNVKRLLRFKDACEKMRDKNKKTINFLIDYEKNESATPDQVTRYQELLDAVRGKEKPPFEQLKKCYVDEKLCRLDELQEYIRVSERAMQLNQNRDALKIFFTKKESEVMTLMRYLHHGLLDFLGENFKQDCVQLFVAQTPTIDIDISSGHETLIKHLKTVFVNVFDRMTQLAGIYQKPFKDAKINVNQTKQGALSFKKYKAFYDSCWWSTNAQRKIQAKGFFGKLENSSSDHSPDTYFVNLFGVIFDTQCQMLKSDKSFNTKRWFGFLNSKGYSRLYDITHSVFAEVMEAYLQAASKGLISETRHRELQKIMYEQLFKVYIPLLCQQLPSHHSFKLGFENLDRNSLTFESDFKALFERQANIPKHLNHLYESIQLFQCVLEKNAEFKFSFK